MKKLLGFVFVFVSAGFLYASPIQEDLSMSDEKVRLSYAVGMLMASNLRTTPLEFDYDAFTEGFKAMFEDNDMQLTEQEAVEIVETAMYYAMEKISEENRRQEEDFLAANSRRDGVQVTSSGLQYEVLVETGNEKPNPDSVVKVNYRGTFIDGTLFDMSDGEGAYIPLEMVIPGWAEGLSLMSLGGKYIIYIPSSMAYGSDGIQNIIPPYSTLIFEVELLEIHAENENLFNYY